MEKRRDGRKRKGCYKDGNKVRRERRGVEWIEGKGYGYGKLKVTEKE